MYRDDEIIELIKANQQAPKWVCDARDNHRKLNALVTGKEFSKELIQEIEKIENLDRQKARKKYSKDIRAVSERITKRRSLVFQADGSSDLIKDLPNKAHEPLEKLIKNFKGKKSLLAYLQEYLFQLMDVDPNGVMLCEYVGAEKIYPTYKSINEIRCYQADGQKLDWILFEPTHINNSNYKKWRFIDDTRDVVILDTGQTQIVMPNETFDHPFGEVPGMIISPFIEVGTEIRLSTVNSIIPDLEEYARDKSILTLYKFLHGFPITWRYKQDCMSCNGSGKTNIPNSKTGEATVKTCSICDGQGRIGKNDVTDVIEIPLPRSSDDVNVAPNLAGFVQPDLETWTQYEKTLRDSEERMEATYWGLDMMVGRNETATGKFIDQGPIINEMDKYADIAEHAYNFFVNLVANWSIPVKEKNQQVWYRMFGRRFIIEPLDSLLRKYQEGVNAGLNNTILDNLLYQIISSQYSTNIPLLRMEQKKSRLEPYVHLSPAVTNNLFGPQEAYKKVLFQQFWEECDKSKDEKALKIEMDKFFTKNKGKFEAPLPKTVNTKI